MIRNRKNRIKAILFGCVLLGMVAFLGIKPLTRAIAQPTLSTPPMQAANLTPNLVDANTRFGFKLFSQLLQGNETNLLISPSSIALALTMTYNGAAGETQQAMATTLELQGMSLEEVNQANAALAASLAETEAGVQLAIANCLWSNQNFDLRPDFVQHNQTFYDAEVATLDFSSPEALRRINGWVNNHTAGKIPTILDQVDPQAVLFLINAIYFKGIWTTPFNPQQTIERPFYRSDGSSTPHAMMTQRGQYQYLETDQFQAISLPYGNERWSFYAFLPKPNSSLQELTAALNPQTWEDWMVQFANRPGTVQIPRFKVEYGASLVEVLKALGMAPAFDPGRANFSNLSADPVYISLVRHKTLMEVNEEGTEAAAATIVGMTRGMAMVNPPFEMTIDHPFFCAVRDNQTGTILFMGTIVDPE